jgi:7,8-dihydroneopterin aldolase/epimerase/oxygenase
VHNLDGMTGHDGDGGESGPARGPRLTGTGTRLVFLRGLELIGSIGIYEHERRYNQRIVVSVDLTVADRYDGIGDDISAVYDYDHAIAAIRECVQRRHYNLIETLAEDIAAAILAAPDVTVIKVMIEKPDVLPSCRSVGIEIERRR